jgi:pSer/pThr/pTyr-binding forkhead associated (FHA) protein
MGSYWWFVWRLSRHTNHRFADLVPEEDPVKERTRLIDVSPRRVAWLYILSGPGAGRDFRLGSKTTIGRDPVECDIVLSDPAVSERHARIQKEGDEFFIYDLASLNHTFVNGQPVQKQILADDDEIRIGNVTLVFKVTPKK